MLVLLSRVSGVGVPTFPVLVAVIKAIKDTHTSFSGVSVMMLCATWTSIAMSALVIVEAGASTLRFST